MSKTFSIQLILLSTAFLLAGCASGQSQQATLVAEALAQTQAFEGGVNTAVAQTEAALPTSTFTLTITPSETSTSTQTPAPIVSWSGEWRIWMEGLTETEVGPEYFEVQIMQSGSLVVLSIDMEGDTLTYSGALSANYLIATGLVSYSGSGATGAAFTWVMNPGGDQFSGSWDGRWFCGARGSAAKPDPCYAP